MKHFWSAHASVLLTAVTWGAAPVAIRFLTDEYEPFTQAFFRYFCASVAVVLYCSIFCRREALMALRAWRPLLLVAGFNVAGMIAWTHGLYIETATIAQLVTKLYLPVVVLVSYILFHDERRVIRSPKFVLGCLLGLVGVAMVLMDNPSAAYIPDINKGTLILCGATLFWSGYNVLAKHVVTGQHPVGLFAVVCVFSTIVLGMFCVALERPVSFGASTPAITFIAAISGVVPIAIGHSAFHYGQKYLGAAYCGSLLLVTPFVSNAMAVLLWEDEVMVLIQWLGTLVLLGGSYLVIQAGRSARQSVAE